MAKPKLVPAVGAAAPAQEQAKTRANIKVNALAMQASYEVEALAALLSLPGLDQRADSFVYVARGIGRRIDELNGIMMCALHGNAIDEDDVREFRRQLYGVVE